MFNDLKKQIIELDEDENGLNTGDKNARDEEIKDLYVDKEELEMSIFYTIPKRKYVL